MIGNTGAGPRADYARRTDAVAVSLTASPTTVTSRRTRVTRRWVQRQLPPADRRRQPAALVVSLITDWFVSSSSRAILELPRRSGAWARTQLLLRPLDGSGTQQGSGSFVCSGRAARWGSGAARRTSTWRTSTAAPANDHLVGNGRRQRPQRQRWQRPITVTPSTDQLNGGDGRRHHRRWHRQRRHRRRRGYQHGRLRVGRCWRCRRPGQPDDRHGNW